MAATIQDIATKVGVSKAAVSRILNHKGSFSEELIAKVERTAQELGYVTMSSLVEAEINAAKTIALIFPIYELPVYGEIIGSLEKAASRYDYSVLLCNSLFDRQKDEETFEMLRKRKIGGIVLGSYLYDSTVIGTEPLPIVTYGYQLREDISAVRCDNYMAGQIAARHLMGKGCKKPLYIAGYPLGLEKDLRYKGFTDTLAPFDITPWVYNITTEMEIRNDVSGTITSMLFEHRDADSIFAETDILAANCIQVCESLGYHVPQDIKIIGFGNRYFTGILSPSLTTIQEDNDRIAMAAVEMLVSMIENGDAAEPCEVVIPVSLVERKTT